MLKDYKGIIYVGSLFTGAAIFAATIPSDGAVCIDTRLLCAPPAVQMGDLPSEDGPQALSEPPRVTAGGTGGGTGGRVHHLRARDLVSGPPVLGSPELTVLSS